MGLKNIEELRKKMRAIQAGPRVVSSYMHDYQKQQRSLAEAEHHLRAWLATMIKRVPWDDFKDDKEIQHFREQVSAMVKGAPLTPISNAPLEQKAKEAEQNYEAAVAARLAKLVASYPAELKPGMVLTNSEREQYVEITSGPTRSDNPHLRGDAGMFYDVLLVHGDEKSSKISFSKETLSPKNGWKYIAHI
jgi:hypothetical protein